MQCDSLTSGSVGIPTFVSYADHRRHILVHMAAVFRNFARSGYTEGQSGHISVRDPEFPGCMWMNPLGRHFAMLTAGDMLLLDIGTGRLLAGRANPAITPARRTANAAGYYIHSEIHKARPADVHAVCHAHTAAGRAWAAFGRPLDMLHQDVCNFYRAHAVYARYGGIVFGVDEGARIAAALGERNKGVILMNHGLLTVGSTVDEAGFLFGLLERSCAIQLQVEAAAAGAAAVALVAGAAGQALRKRLISDEEAAYNFRLASETHVLYREARPDVELEMELAGGKEALARGLETLEIDRAAIAHI
jgi:ribulose-5-phosphate 4-epimerase/fuculose-1-phosphate aldolase